MLSLGLARFLKRRNSICRLDSGGDEKAADQAAVNAMRMIK